SELWALLAGRARRIDGVWTFYDVHPFKKAADTNAMVEVMLQTNVLAVPEFSETPEEINSEIKISDSMSLRAAKKADVPIKDLVNYLRLHPRLDRSRQYWLYTKLEGR